MDWVLSADARARLRVPKMRKEKLRGNSRGQCVGGGRGGGRLHAVQERAHALHKFTCVTVVPASRSGALSTRTVMAHVIRFLLMLAIALIAVLLSDALYAFAVVPRLASVHAVPLLWWLTVASPVVVAFIVVATRLRSWGELLVSATAIALLLLVHVVVLVLLRFPGTRMMKLQDVSARFIVEGLAMGFGAVLVALALGYRATRNLSQ